MMKMKTMKTKKITKKTTKMKKKTMKTKKKKIRVLFACFCGLMGVNIMGKVKLE
jgi:mannitol-specific phosphotransferase system IIBC component